MCVLSVLTYEKMDIIVLCFYPITDTVQFVMTFISIHFLKRIEAWWSMLRRRFTTWWIDFFRDLASFGAFEMGNENDM